MGVVSKKLWLAALLCLLGQLPRAGRALGSLPEEAILLVGVTHGQRSDGRLARTLEEHLRRTGEIVAPSTALFAAERLCSDGECLEQLARREHAQLALTVQVRDSGPQSYFITMALLDTRRRVPIQTESVCDACSAEDLATRLSDLSDKALRLHRERLQADATPPGGTAIGTGSSPAIGLPLLPPPNGSAPTGSAGRRARPFAELTTGRKIAAGVLGAAAIGVLVPSIFWTVKDGQPAPPPCADSPLLPQDCRYDNKALYGVGYGLTAALAGGLLAVLFWPPSAAPPPATASAEKAP